MSQLSRLIFITYMLFSLTLSPQYRSRSPCSRRATWLCASKVLTQALLSATRIIADMGGNTIYSRASPHSADSNPILLVSGKETSLCPERSTEVIRAWLLSGLRPFHHSCAVSYIAPPDLLNLICSPSLNPVIRRLVQAYVPTNYAG